MAEPVKAKPVDSPLPINNAVTQFRQPLATIDIPSAMDVSFGEQNFCMKSVSFFPNDPKLNLEFSESPMDMSVIEGEEKPADVNEVSEYATEIHEYLRELEVRHLTASHRPQWRHFFKTACGGLTLPCCPHSGENQAESRLHEEAARHHQQHAGHPGGLAGRGRGGIQAPE